MKDPDNSQPPKWRSFEKFNALIREDQLEFLGKIERQILKNRDSSHRKERITKNSVLRAAIDLVISLQFDLTNISDEDAFLERLMSAVAQSKDRKVRSRKRKSESE